MIIENDGQANADDISIWDDLSFIETQLVDGTTGKAFTEWTLTSRASGSNAEYVEGVPLISSLLITCHLIFDHLFYTKTFFYKQLKILIFFESI